MIQEHDTTIKEFLKKGAEVRLSTDVRAHMRETLRTHAAAHPVIISPTTRLDEAMGGGTIPSPFYQYWKHSMPIIAGLLIAVFVGGGVSYAAEGALPGEVLYPIKVHVNESVRETLALSSEAKANVEADIASRRVEEAKELAVQGILSTSTVAELKVTFEDHAKKARKVAREAHDDDPKRADDVHMFVDARLTADAEVLREIEDIVVSGRIHTYVRDDQDKHGKNKRVDNNEGDDDSRSRIDLGADGEVTVSASSSDVTSPRSEDDRRSGRDDTSDSDDDRRTRIETDAHIDLDL